MPDQDSSTNPVSDRALKHLQGMRPWHQLVSVLLFINVALMTIGGMLMLASSGKMGFLGFLFLAAGVLYMLPALHLWRSAKNLKANQIEDSLENQYKFWQFIGVAVVCALLFTCLAALALLAGALSDTNWLYF